MEFIAATNNPGKMAEMRRILERMGHTLSLIHISGLGQIPEKDGNTMSKLVIVESPAKAKTIRKYLGGGYELTASMGHIRDLPQSQLGIDVEHGYAPQYINIKGKEKIIKELKSLSLIHIFPAWARSSSTVWRRPAIRAAIRCSAPM